MNQASWVQANIASNSFDLQNKFVKFKALGEEISFNLSHEGLESAF